MANPTKPPCCGCSQKHQFLNQHFSSRHHQLHHHLQVCIDVFSREKHINSQPRPEGGEGRFEQKNTQKVRAASEDSGACGVPLGQQSNRLNSNWKIHSTKAEHRRAAEHSCLGDGSTKKQDKVYEHLPRSYPWKTLHYLRISIGHHFEVPGMKCAKANILNR